MRRDDQVKSVDGRTRQKVLRNRSGRDEIRFGEGYIMLGTSQFRDRKNQGSGQE